MKTSELIEALATDMKWESSPTRIIILSVSLGSALSFIGLWATIGMREDLGTALYTWRFDLKLAVIALVFVLAMIDTVKLVRPTGRHLPGALNSLPIWILLSAACVELTLVPADAWHSSLVGTNAVLCLVAIPALSLAPLFFIFVAMRSAAPRCPISAGAAAGRLAAAIGALFYGLHCFDDSPLFVITWYTLAVAPIVAIAAVYGRFRLRW